MTVFGLPWNVWEPVYEIILREFGFSRAADEAARDDLENILEGGGLRPDDLPDARNRTVAIVGAGPNLGDELERAAEADLVFAASTASEKLLTAGIEVTIHDTDIDKDETVVRELVARNRPVAVHAHGDNTDALASIVPSLDPSCVFPTTQAAPIPGVANPGGFTDGDRAAFLADALGAESLVFPGWDFTDPSVSATKRRKLVWAERLLAWLEQRRDDRFSVLNGRRSAIELPAEMRPASDGSREG